MDNEQPIAILRNKNSQQYTIKAVLKPLMYAFGGFLLVYYVGLPLFVDDPVKVAEKQDGLWITWLAIMSPTILTQIAEFYNQVTEVHLFQTHLQVKVGLDQIKLIEIAPKDINEILVIQQTSKNKPTFRESINTGNNWQIPPDLDKYHYTLKYQLSALFANKIGKNYLFFKTQNFELSDVKTLLDWLQHNRLNPDIPIRQDTTNTADIGTMVLILMMIGIIGGIAIGVMYDKIGIAYHFVGNYLFLLALAFVIAFIVSFMLIKRQKKALWFLTTLIATGFLTPMLYGLSMKSYELYHEHQVASQKLKPNYEFEFVLTKNAKDKQQWEIINFYQNQNGKIEKTEQPQFRDLTLYATPNDKLWQPKATNNQTLKLPVYQIGDDWFFAYHDFAIPNPKLSDN